MNELRWTKELNWTHEINKHERIMKVKWKSFQMKELLIQNEITRFERTKGGKWIKVDNGTMCKRMKLFFPKELK